MRILIAGDFCPSDRIAVLFENKDFESVLGNVKETITSADYAIVNFECPITCGEENPIPKCGPNLSCSQNGLYAAKWAGFNCVTLANNHFYDYGDTAVKNTLSIADRFGIDHVGGGSNIEEASKTLYKTIENKKLAIINCCEHEFSIATEKSGGSNPLNPISQYYAIREARLKADYILVIVHGGYELYQLPSPRMVDTYRFFIDCGADAVINHHQHCFSGYEEYKGKPIFYGLGNFCFDNSAFRHCSWNDGFMVSISFNETISYSIIPYHQCDDYPEIALRSFDTFTTRIEELNDTISNKEKLAIATKEYFDYCGKQYSDIFEPIDNKLYYAFKSRGWLPSLISIKRKLRAANYICCEAHRDKLIHWLINLHK